LTYRHFVTLEEVCGAPVRSANFNDFTDFDHRWHPEHGYWTEIFNNRISEYIL
jgi:hypothetical protein